MADRQTGATFRRRAALGGIVGPIAFVAAWSLTGVTAAGYSVIDDPISDLAAVHAPTRVAMTAGFLVFSSGMWLYAVALRDALRGPAWVAAAATGCATFGVAAFPLGHSRTIDAMHRWSAGAGYVALAATALFAVAPLARRDLRPWAVTAATMGCATAIALALIVTGSFGGLLQRIGLTAGDCWVIASAVAIRRRAWQSRSGALAM